MVKRYVGPSKLSGRVTPPPSKSLLHRVLICAALSEKSTLDIGERTGITPGISEDIDTTMDCLSRLMQPLPTVQLNCAESGSTLRFLIPIAAALGKTAVFTGRGRLPKRPLDEYVSIFGGKGVALNFHTLDSLPMTVSGQLKAGVFQVPGNVSSQYITGLLMALPLLDQDSEIHLTTPLESAPYVDLTMQVMQRFGVIVHPIYKDGQQPAGWKVQGRQQYVLPPNMDILEADYSQAAFWLTAQYMGHPIEVCGLSADSLQGDRAIVRLLHQLKQKQPHQELRIDASQCPDLVPILAVAAAYAPGRTVIGNAARLALKESNRLTATADVLTAIGAHVQATADAVVIQGTQQIIGGKSHAHGDHRIAMALAIAALGSQNGVTIEGSDAVNKSYPDFFEELIRLGGDVRVV